MKSLLVILNVLLAGAVLWGGVRFFKSLSSDHQPKAGFTVKKRNPKVSRPVAERKPGIPSTRVPDSRENQVRQIVELNIFDPERCPNAGIWGGSNARMEMTLVGTFKIGQTQGAIILQKTQTRNFPFMPFGGMMNNSPDGLPPRRQGIGRNNAFNGSNPARTTGNIPRQIGGSRSMQAYRNAQGNVMPGQNQNAKITYKQYVRLGETMANGYKLSEVDRNRVVLIRGSDKLELELSDASKNVPQTARRTRPASQTQIMQQMLQSMQNMQRAQMMQGFQMMRMNQQNMQNMQNQPGGGRGGMVPRRR